MNRRVIVSAAMAMALAVPGFTLAQGYGDQGNRGRDNQVDNNRRDNNSRDNNGQDNRAGNNGRDNNGHDNRVDNNGRDNRSDRNDHGAGPNHAYHKGDRLRPEEHRKEYVVNDWRTRHLRQPPKGHHWVRAGDDYVLAAIATGVIADIVLANR